MKVFDQAIDLRSDTVTKPDAGMLNAMLNAKVGDDVFGEDPTINELERELAKLFGMESGLLVPSGTMGNQLALHVHCKPGDEVICHENSHIYQYESGAMAANSGVQPKLLGGERGILNHFKIAESVNPPYDWLTRSRLVCIENSCNKAGGSVYTLAEMKAIHDVCNENNLIYHLDGARIFNALHAINATSLDICGVFDSISVCLSKGLGAPLGSVLLGSHQFIKEARRVRKRWGGGMRQAGYFAAAGLYALKHNIQRLKDDHIHAQVIARALTEHLDVESILPIETNIIIYSLKNSVDSLEHLNTLAKNQILALPFGKKSIRMVLHKDITPEKVDYVLEFLSK